MSNLSDERLASIHNDIIQRKVYNGQVASRDRLSPDDRKQYDEFVRKLRGEETPGTKALGVLEAGRTFVQGAVAQPIAGIAGLGTLAMGGSLDDAVDTIQDVSGNLSYTPTTQMGRDIVGGVATALEPIERVMSAAGQETFDRTRSPLAATGVRTLLEMGPSMFGVQNPIRVARQSRSGVQQANKLLQEAGITVSPTFLQSISIRGIPSSGRIAEALKQVPEAAAALRRSTEVKGQDLLQIQKGVQEARKGTRNSISQMYKQATEAGTVRVPINEVKLLNETLANAMAPFEMANIQPVRNLLDEFTSIIEPAPRRFQTVNVSRRGIGGTRLSRDVNAPVMTTEQLQRGIVELNDISEFRRKLSLAQRGSNPEVSAAALVMKKNIDDWLDAQFDMDMMSGSADAILKWKNANTAYREYAKTFKENKVMVDLFQSEATPEMVHNWIFGTSAVGAKPESALVVKRLNQVLGRNSTEMNTLRSSAAFDMVYPLLRDNLSPKNVENFRKNYVNFVRTNDSLSKEMFTTEQLRAFETLNRSITAAADMEFNVPPALLSNIDRSLAIAIFPKAQGLATGSTVLNVAQNAIKRIKSAAKGDNRRSANNFYSELSGINVGQPLFSARTPAVASFIQAGFEQPDEYDRLQEYLTTGTLRDTESQD